MRDIFIRLRRKKQIARRLAKYKKFCMKAHSMTYRETEQMIYQICDRYQFTIFHLYSYVKSIRESQKEIKSVYELRKTRWEMKNVAMAWDARRLIVKSGSRQKKQNALAQSKGINKLSYLMLFWSIYLRLSTVRAETLWNGKHCRIK